MNYAHATWRTQWNQRLGEMLGALHTPGLADLMVEALRSVVTFRHAVTFGYPLNRRPVLLHNAMASEQRASAVTSYIRGSYVVDPFYEAVCRRIPQGIYRMEDLAPDEFFTSVGAHPGYVSPCVSDEPGVLSEEVGFFADNAEGPYVVLSLMRDSDQPPFSETEMNILREIEPVVCNALVTNFRHALSGKRPGLESDAATGLGTIFDQLARCGVTERECQVARLLLCGHSTLAIADRLEIAPPTVKVHRRNLYSKLNISTQAEFFAFFLDTLVGGMPSADL